MQIASLKVSAVADLLKKFIITERDAKKSKPEATSGSNTKVDCETQTEENSRQRDCANADGQETLRRLEEKYLICAMYLCHYL